MHDILKEPAIRSDGPASGLKAFLADENGATAIEYGLIVSLIFLAIVAAIRSYTDSASVMYSNIADNMATP